MTDNQSKIQSLNVDVYSIEQIKEFYHNTFITGQFILRLILDEKEQYSKLKHEDSSWSDLTLHISTLNNQALRLYSLMKYKFNHQIKEVI